MSSQFEIASSVPSDLYRSFFIFYNESGLIESFLNLLASSTLSYYNSTVIAHFVEFINVLTDSHDGLLFLIHYPRDVVHRLLRLLLGKFPTLLLQSSSNEKSILVQTFALEKICILKKE